MVQSDPLQIASTQHVTIIGAGIKGLFAARQLCKFGYHVTIIEREKQAGGKIKTVRSNKTYIKDSNGYDWSDYPALVEMGPMRILETHQNTLKLLEELELDVIPYVEDNGNAPFFINGKRGNVDNLNVGVLIDVGLISNEIIQAESSLTRETNFTEVLLRAFKNVDEVIQTTGCLIRKGQTSVSEYLDLPGKDSGLRACAKVILALRNGENGNHHFEAVDEFTNILKLHSGNPISVKDGFDLIVSRLIKQLINCSILYSSEVTEVRDQGLNGIKIMFKTDQNQIDSIQSNGLIIACPAVHNIHFSPNLPSEHYNILEKLKTSCIPALKCALHFKERFWEKKEHGKIFGGTGWISPSDTHQIFLPSSVSSDKSGYLMIYLRGDPVNQWLHSSKEVRIEKILSDLGCLFPSAKDCIRNLFQGFIEEIWNEKGAGAYVLQNAKSLRDTLRPHGRMVFSPVPRGWIDDTLNDAQIAVDKLHRVLASQVPKQSTLENTHIQTISLNHKVSNLKLVT